MFGLIDLLGFDHIWVFCFYRPHPNSSLQCFHVASWERDYLLIIARVLDKEFVSRIMISRTSTVYCLRSIDHAYLIP